MSLGETTAIQEPFTVKLLAGATVFALGPVISCSVTVCPALTVSLPQASVACR